MNGAVAIEHPCEPDLGFLYGVILTDHSPAEDVFHPVLQLQLPLLEPR